MSKLTVKQLGCRWWIQGVAIRSFPSKRACLAAVRMIELQSCNPRDARIVIEADTKSLRESPGMKLTYLQALGHAVDVFATTFGEELHLSFPEATEFFGQYRKRVEEEKRHQTLA